MANRKLAKTFMPVTVLSATTEAGSFPKENIIDRTSPQRAWRSTSIAADQRVVIDLGAAQTDVACYLDWVNFGSFKYQESADGVSGWADVTSTLTVEKDPMHGVFRRVDGVTMTGKRYLGIYIPAQTPVDSAAYFRIGTFCVPESIVELDAETTVEYPFDVALPDSYMVENRFPGGRAEKIKLGVMQPMMISFALKTGAMQNIKGAQVEEIAELLRDGTETLWIDFNLGETWQAYLVKKSGELRATVSTPEISRKSYKALKETQPDCSAQIGALEAAEDKTDPAAVTSDLILDALYCYRSVWKHWENEYRVLDAQLDMLNPGDVQK